MIDGRKRIIRLLATLSITAVGSSVLVAAPTFAKPDIPGVRAKVDTLYHQAERASERYNGAKLEMRKDQTRLHALESDLHRQQTKVNTVRRQVASSVVAQAQGQALSSTTQVMLSNNPDAFLDELSTVSQYNDQRSQMMADFAVQAKRLEMRQADAKRELSRITATKEQLGAEKARIDDRSAKAKQLLSTLKDRAAQARASRSEDRTAAAAPTTAPATVAAPTTAAPASGRAAAAVNYALAQVGKAYVYGAAGPSAFDCSGLTMMAWQQAGVGLPHSSGAQMGSGTPVSQSELQPGDLVFYYSPVSHVGMYIGNGQIVNAENPSVGVKITGVNSMPYAGAVRPG